MTFFEFISSLSALVQSLSTFLARAESFVNSQSRLFRRLNPGISYENLRLDVLFDILDARGKKAVVSRRQSVRFLVRDSGVIRDLAWGEGNSFAGYSVEGATYLGVRAEGPKRVMLLSLGRSPDRGEQATVRTRRVVENALTRADGYAEVFVERRTERLSLTVRFPRTRPPKEARLITSPPGRATAGLRCRYDADGRPYLRWTARRPDSYVTYSVRWRW